VTHPASANNMLLLDLSQTCTWVRDVVPANFFLNQEVFFKRQ
jgi:hypothetical protein